ncbi:MAG: PKD domain-containing protein [Firmicutes bacterium]|nr:PKD domain-containing protein [Bacillota bacterium]
MEKSIQVVNAAPIAAFSFTPESPDVGQVVAFTNESTDDGEIVACFWEFGDGTTSVQWSPEHEYSSTGTFVVRLTVIDDDNAAGSITHEIEIVNAPPQAAFSFAPSPATVYDIVKFTDESIDDGEIVAWHWEFGDGAESNEQNPEHQYTTKGEFQVRLTVTDDGGLLDTAEDTILIVNLPPEVEIIKPVPGQVLAGEETIQWQAVDPDNDADELKITLECRLMTSEDWQTIASDLANTGEFVWDTSRLERGGKYVMRITAVDPDGARGEATSEAFTVIVLAQAVVAAPNPASDSVTFYYDIATNGTLYVYDIVGRLVHSAELSAAMHAHEWNLDSGGKPVANGIYLYFVVAGKEKSEVGRLVVNR